MCREYNMYTKKILIKRSRILARKYSITFSSCFYQNSDYFNQIFHLIFEIVTKRTRILVGLTRKKVKNTLNRILVVLTKIFFSVDVKKGFVKFTGSSVLIFAT